MTKAMRELLVQLTDAEQVVRQHLANRDVEAAEAAMQRVRNLKAQIEDLRAKEEAELRRERRGRMLFSGHEESPTNGATGRRTFAALFPNLHRENATGGFDSFGDYFKAIMSTRHDPRLDRLVNRGGMAGSGEDGGFAVPPRYVEKLFDAIVEESVFASRAQLEGLTERTIYAPAWADLDQSDGALYGGFKAVWSEEDALNEEQFAKLRQIELEAKALRLYTSLTRELAFFSSPNMEQELQQALIRTIAHGIDVAAMTGDGNGKPLGVLSAPSTIAVERTEAGRIQWHDIARMLGRLHSAALDDAIWIASPDILPELLTMQDQQGSLIWAPSARDGAPDMLAGKPLFYRDRLPGLGERGDLTLVSPRHYILALAPNIWLDASTGPHWFHDRLALRAVTFADGKPQWDTVYTPPSGTTKSWAVTLDAVTG